MGSALGGEFRAHVAGDFLGRPDAAIGRRWRRQRRGTASAARGGARRSASGRRSWPRPTNWRAISAPGRRRGATSIDSSASTTISRRTSTTRRPSIPVGFPSATWGSLASFGARAYPGTKKWYGTSGNSFVAVVEFGKTVRAKAVTAGGESGDPASPHFNDEAQRYATGRLRDVYYYRAASQGTHASGSITLGSDYRRWSFDHPLFRTRLQARLRWSVKKTRPADLGRLRRSFSRGSARASGHGRVWQKLRLPRTAQRRSSRGVAKWPLRGAVTLFGLGPATKIHISLDAPARRNLGSLCAHIRDRKVLTAVLRSRTFLSTSGG